MQKTAGMGDRRCHETGILGTKLQRLDKTALTIEDGVMGMNNALGFRFRARGKQDGRHIVGLRRQRNGAFTLAQQRIKWHTGLPRPVCKLDDEFLAMAGPENILNMGGMIRIPELACEDERLALAGIDDIFDVFPAIGHRHRIDDRTHPERRQNADHRLPPVRRAHRDDILFPDPGVGKTRSDTLNMGVEFLIGKEVPLRIRQRRPFRMVPHHVLEQLGGTVETPMGFGVVTFSYRRIWRRKLHAGQPFVAGRPAIFAWIDSIRPPSTTMF